MKKILDLITGLLLLLNSIILIGTTVDLISFYTGKLIAYLFALPVAAILSPTLIALPWFESWVVQEPVSTNLLFIWGLWIFLTLINLLLHILKK